MQITINGEAATIAEEISIADLLRNLDKNPKFLAVERNRQLVPRAEHAACLLTEGDEIEIVTLVGGG